MTTKTIILETRWPVEQTGPRTIRVNIPAGPHGCGLVSITPGAIDALKLSDKEIEKAHEAAEQAAITALIIL